jgi:hypothetical protein
MPPSPTLMMEVAISFETLGNMLRNITRQTEQDGLEATL